MLTGSFMISLYLAASLIGFSTGAVISALLLALTARATRLPGASAANILFATCCLVWNLSGLAHSLALACGAPEQGRTELIILACQYTAAAAWPISVLSLWSPLATLRWQRIGCRSLQALAAITCTLIVIPLWHGVLTGATSSLLFLMKSTPYNGAILLTLGIALFRGRLTSQAMRLPVLAMLLGAFGATTAVIILQVLPFEPVVVGLLRAVSEQITLLIVLGAFFLFARFRFSDLFIRHSLRVVLAALTAVAVTLSYYTLSLFRFDGRLAYPAAARVCLDTLTAVPILVLFAFVDRHIGEYVNRWIFRAPDYRALLRELSEKLARLRSETEIADAVETTARQSLELRTVQLVTLESFSKTSLSTSNRPHSHQREPDLLNALNDGEPVELDCQHPKYAGQFQDEVELLVPVRSEGRVTQMLAISPGPARRGLVTHEVNYLRGVAAQFGHRLDALHMEERLISVQSREAVLLQQVTEAELRALRAQVNPHFLFNSLNSIYSLAYQKSDTTPEAILKLSEIMRYMLYESNDNKVDLAKELQYLQNYIDLQKIRFGSKAFVELKITGEVGSQKIVPLLLIAFIENAFKHGVANDPNMPIRLLINLDGTNLHFYTENKKHMNNRDTEGGIGLQNVKRRLDLLYPGKYKLDIKDTPDIYTCELSLVL